jgi:hypothetical protein
MNRLEPFFAFAHNILMVINNFHPIRVAVAPDEANPPLVIDANAVLADAAALQGFQPVARRRQQIAQCPRPVQVFQFSPGGILNVRRQLAGAFSPKDSFRLTAREAGYHQTIIPHRGIMSSLRMRMGDGLGQTAAPRK